MNVFQAAFLGILQGVTEFLPISSSAHLVLAPWFFKWQDPGLAFDVALHGGTLIALFLYFIRDWWDLGQAGLDSILERKIGFNRNRAMFWLMALATLPAVISGWKFHEMAETVFREPVLIAIPLALVGFLMYWVDGFYSLLRNFDDIEWKDALFIGLAQAFSVIPGVSRSGSTMTMARAMGLNREASARFSFLLCFPITLGACLFEGRKLIEVTDMGITHQCLIVGFVCSAISGMLAIHFVLGLLRYGSLRWFAWYRITLAVIVIITNLVK